MDRALNGINNGSAYLGVNATTPPDLVVQGRPPTETDYQNYNIGTLWLDNKTNIPATAEDIYMLVSVARSIGVWVPLSGGGDLQTLTGDTGGPVSADANDNISIVSGIDGLSIDGNPGTSTLTINKTGTGPLLQTLTADNGGAIDPDANGTIFISATHNITSDGDPGTNTITIQGTNEITLGDLTPIAQGNDAITLTTGDIVLNSASGVVGAEGVAKIKFFPALIGQPTNDIYFYRNNVFIGSDAGNQATTSTFNIGIGGQTSRSMTTGTGNIGVGQGTNDGVSTGQNNCMYGYTSGSSNIVGDENSAYGDGAWANGTGSQNCAFGNGALGSLVDGNLNIGIGNEAGALFVGSESNNTIIGHIGVAGADSLVVIGTSDGGRVLHNYPGVDASTVNAGNIFVGKGSGNLTLTGSGTNAGNTGVGDLSLSALTTGYVNTAVGAGALTSLTTGNSNLALGVGAGFDESLGTGLMSGVQNIMIGYQAGSAYTGAESNNITISTDGVTGESLTTRIGGFNVGEPLQTKCFIQGIRGITTVVNNAVAVLIDSAGQLGTISSSERYKENITDMEDNPLMELRPVSFNYKGDDSLRYGLIAEEVADTFPYLAVFNESGEPETVKYHEMATLLLYEMQKMQMRIEELEDRVSSLQER